MNTDRFGYKAMLQPKEEFVADTREGNWICARYKQNRASIFSGDLPHYSSPVEALPMVDGETPKRVILGFNFFSKEVGECCMRAPEHSEAFNRTVKLYQVLIR